MRERKTRIRRNIRRVLILLYSLCFSMPFVQIRNVYIEKQKKQRTKAEFNRKERTVRESEQ